MTKVVQRIKEKVLDLNPLPLLEGTSELVIEINTSDKE